MWHFKTLCGIFWLVPEETQEGTRFFLGVDEEPLGSYISHEAALMDINHHTTGYLDWDTHAKTQVPTQLELWNCGEPHIWHTASC